MQYVLLSAHGFLDERLRDLRVKAESGGAKIGTLSVGIGPLYDDSKKLISSDIDIVDGIAENGPKLVTMGPERAREIRNEIKDFELAPVRTYRPALMPLRRVSRKSLYSGATSRTVVRFFIYERGTGKPVVDATVIAVFDRARGLGLRRRSGVNGQVTITFPTTETWLDDIFVHPGWGFWGIYRRDLTLSEGDKFDLDRIDFKVHDFLQSIYGEGSVNDGEDVRVGIIDTGIDHEHPELNVCGGENFATDGQPSDYGAGSDGHGTHVAGIVGARGAVGSGMRGIAPASQLYSYRVFPKTGGTTTNVAIAKAIHRAVGDGCHLINLSLGGGAADPVLNRAIGYAFSRGVVCVVAAGNSGRRAVSYPAWYKRALAVSALGSTDFLPEHASDRSEVDDPISSINPSHFIAAFSNIGEEIDFTAPGVGIVSCFPGARYAVMSGTSMAAPAVTGLIARLLSRHPGLLGAEGNLARARAIIDMVRDHSITAGFEPAFEGFGMPMSPLPVNSART